MHTRSTTTMPPLRRNSQFFSRHRLRPPPIRSSSDQIWSDPSRPAPTSLRCKSENMWQAPEFFEIRLKTNNNVLPVMSLSLSARQPNFHLVALLVILDNIQVGHRSCTCVKPATLVCKRNADAYTLETVRCRKTTKTLVWSSEKCVSDIQVSRNLWL